MKKITERTLEDAIKTACKEMECEESDLMYSVLEEKKGLFKKAIIEVYDVADVIEYAENYIKNLISSLGLEVSLQTVYRDKIAKILIETNKNSLIIGQNGSTLQSLNELVKLAVNSKFKKKFRILLDISDYKDKKYRRSIATAKKIAKEVLKTHVDVKLDPMTPDERKKVHTALASFKNIKTESIGDGKDRAIVIKYIGNDNKATTSTPKEENTENE